MSFCRLLTLRLVATGLAAIAVAGCSHDPLAFVEGALEPRVEPVWVPAGGMPAPMPIAATTVSDGAYLLDTGDKLRVFVYGQPNLSRAYTVDHDGKISVPLIGEVMVRGQTTRDVEGAIRGLLGREFVRDPQVTVDVLQNRPFFVYGEVKQGGQFPFVSGMTVETAVAIAGGFSDRASTSTFRITRRSNGMVEELEVPRDYPLQPGDTVFVTERFL